MLSNIWSWFVPRVVVAHTREEPTPDDTHVIMSKPLEFEFQYLDFDEAEVKSALSRLNAVYKGTFLFKAFNFKTKSNTWIRVRDESHRITLTAKYKEPGSKFDTEHEVFVSDFETTADIISLIAPKTYYIEKIREIYCIDECELIFDTAPGFQTRIEIEGPSEEQINALAAKLNLTPNNASIAKNFSRFYGAPLDKMRANRDLTFENVNDKFMPLITKNKEHFIERIQHQMSLLAHAR